MHENDPTNVMTERSIDGIYLYPNTNQQGGHTIMNLNTGKIITRGRVVTVPLSKTIKDAVEQMAYRQGFTKMKYSNKNGLTIPNLDWDAGNDYKLDILNIEGPDDQIDEADDEAYEQRTAPRDTHLAYDDDIDEQELMDLSDNKIPESETAQRNDTNEQYELQQQEQQEQHQHKENNNQDTNEESDNEEDDDEYENNNNRDNESDTNQGIEEMADLIDRLQEDFEEIGRLM